MQQDQVEQQHRETGGLAPVNFIENSLGFNVQINRRYTNTSGDISICKILSEVLREDMLQMSQVTLHSMFVTYVATGERQELQCGFSHANATRSAAAVGMMKGGISYLSNAFNYGVKHVDELVIPQTFARQLQPYDPSRPAPKFYLKAHKSMFVSVTYNLLFADYLIIHDEAVVSD